MLPSGFVNGGEEADDFVVFGPIVEEVCEGAYRTNHNKAKPEIKCRIHGFIITLVVWFR